MEFNPRRPQGLQALRGLSLLLGLIVLGGCDADQQSGRGLPLVAAADAAPAAVKREDLRTWMTVGELWFAITLTDSEAARAFVAQLPS